MVMLLLTHADTNKSLDQIVMFVPTDFDAVRVWALAHDLGISEPMVALQMDIPAMLAPHLVGVIDEYAAYCR